MRYQAALDHLYSFVDYETRRTASYDPENYNLARMRWLLKALGSPESGMTFIHVAGTKGKGSTAAICLSILEAMGLRVGLFTSPHLVDVRERFRIGDRMISRPELTAIVGRLRRVTDRLDGRRVPTTFELFTALAVLFFRSQRPDIAILETGMGGRLDSTNFCRPAVAAITRIGHDHVEKLGGTLKAIAGEKAGIFKRGAPAVVSEPQAPGVGSFLRERAAALGCGVVDAGEDYRIANARFLPDGTEFTVPVAGRLFLPLAGEHQLENFGCAMGVLRALGLEPDAETLRRGLTKVRWPGRLEYLRKGPFPVLADGAHNPESASSLGRALRRIYLRAGTRMTLVLGILKDKDAAGICRPLVPLADRVIVCSPGSHRDMDPTRVMEVVKRMSDRVRFIAAPADVIRHLTSTRVRREITVITGSLYTVAAFIPFFQGTHRRRGFKEFGPRLSSWSTRSP